jgi:hypothetical protein
MLRLLSASEPLVFVAGSPPSVSLARRLAHDLLVNHRLDSEILGAEDALRLAALGSLGDGNLVVIGSPEDNIFARWLIANSPSPCA